MSSPSPDAAAAIGPAADRPLAVSESEPALAATSTSSSHAKHSIQPPAAHAHHDRQRTASPTYDATPCSAGHREATPTPASGDGCSSRTLDATMTERIASHEGGLGALAQATRSAEEAASSGHRQSGPTGSGALYGAADVQRTLSSQPRNSEPYPASSTIQQQAAPSSAKPSGVVAVPDIGFKPIASMADRRQAGLLASEMLALLHCPACNQILSDPVTLPCGHSSCLNCILNRSTKPPLVADSSLAPPSDSHVPPRLPLSAMSVPCTVADCPRSAIGRGLGVWSGHHAKYGPSTAGQGASSSKHGHHRASSSSTGPGQLPVDGFVTGTDDSNMRLSVIPPQSKAEGESKYAIPPFGQDPATVSASSSTERSWLRLDVTLAKAIQMLKATVASTPPPPRPRSRATDERNALTTPHARALRERGALRARRRLLRTPVGRGPSGPSSLGSSSSSRTSARSTLHHSDRRSEISPNFLPLIGGSEADFESGSVGGVRATWDTDEEEEEEERRKMLQEQWQSAVDHLARRADDGVLHGETDVEAEEEDNLDGDDDDIGGAFARPLRTSHRTVEDDIDRRAARHGHVHRRGDTLRGRAQRWRAQHLRLTPPAARGLGNDSEGWDTDASTSSVHDTAGHKHAHSADSPSPTSGPAPSKVAMLDADKTPVSATSTAGGPNVPAGGIESMHAELCDVLECQLCYLLLYEPLTTPCGHTFCRPCFARSLDHGSTCPLCRTAMPSFSFFQEHPANNAIVKLLNYEHTGGPDTSRPRDHAAAHHAPADDVSLKSIAPQSWGFKSLYAERRAAVEADERDALLSTPIFVCTLAFPSMPTILHIFEPRYRLMIRRCLESPSPRFGMVLPSRVTTGPTAGLSEYGTMLDIKSVQMLPDGRSLIETVGASRFRLLEKGSLDGYTVGRIDTIEDTNADEEAALERAVLMRNQEREAMAASGVSSGGAAPSGVHMATLERLYATLAPEIDLGLEADQAEPTLQELIQTCTSFITTLRSGSAPWLVTRLNHTYGPMPDSSEVERLGYWMALVMPIDEHEKAKLLPIRSARLRLRLVVHWIEQLRQSWWFSSGCSVQ